VRPVRRIVLPAKQEVAMLGVLGGMGPMATVDFLGKVVQNTPAACDQDHIQMVVCSAANIPDRSAAILGEGADPFPAIRDALRRLEAAGATCIAIPCNTAHHWHAALQAETSVPILHIVDAVADTLVGQGREGGCIGVLATDGTVRAGIYPKRLAQRGFSCRCPTWPDRPR
jgi:aspartate racemase